MQKLGCTIRHREAICKDLVKTCEVAAKRGQINESQGGGTGGIQWGSALLEGFAKGRGRVCVLGEFLADEGSNEAGSGCWRRVAP